MCTARQRSRPSSRFPAPRQPSALFAPRTLGLSIRDQYASSAKGGTRLMLTLGTKQWGWLIAGACLLSATPSVWAGNVSPSIQDTGTAVGIGTTTPTPGYKLEL